MALVIILVDVQHLDLLRVCDALFCFVFEAQHQTQPSISRAIVFVMPCFVLFCFVFEAQHQTQPSSHQHRQVKRSGRWPAWLSPAHQWI
jgi:hypothetical protein